MQGTHRPRTRHPSRPDAGVGAVQVPSPDGIPPRFLIRSPNRAAIPTFLRLTEGEWGPEMAVLVVL